MIILFLTAAGSEYDSIFNNSQPLNDLYYSVCYYVMLTMIVIKTFKLNAYVLQCTYTGPQFCDNTSLIAPIYS